MLNPRLEIDLNKIFYNAKFLVDLFRSEGIGIMGVTKGVLGEPQVAEAMIQAGVESIGDSRIENIRRMREAGIEVPFVLIRSPMLSQAEDVVQYADISLNTEISVLEKLSRIACESNRPHGVILMVELGDLREGIPLEELESTIEAAAKLPGLNLTGLGTNLGCIGGVIPAEEKMDQLSRLVDSIERTFNFNFKIVSGGNSANFNWFKQCASPGRINNLRIGETLLLGHNTLDYLPIKDLCLDAITLVAEVIEYKTKGSVPQGNIGYNAFGQSPNFRDRGQIDRAILGLGRQDVLVSGLTPLEDVEILGSSSDHVVINVQQQRIKVGDEFRFRMNYGALLSAMTSPHVTKRCFKTSTPKNPNISVCTEEISCQDP